MTDIIALEYDIEHYHAWDLRQEAYEYYKLNMPYVQKNKNGFTIDLKGKIIEGKYIIERTHNYLCYINLSIRLICETSHNMSVYDIKNMESKIEKTVLNFIEVKKNLLKKVEGIQELNIVKFLVLKKTGTQI
jgi:hypothetical protein